MSDMRRYFDSSEQIASVFDLHTEFDDAGEVAYCGGILVQKLPGGSLQVCLSTSKHDAPTTRYEHKGPCIGRPAPHLLTPTCRTPCIEAFMG